MKANNIPYYIIHRVLPFFLLVLFAYATVTGGFLVPIALIAISVLVLGLYHMAIDPRFGIKIFLVSSFIVNGVEKYGSAPFGLTTDFLLVLIFILFFLREYKTVEWKRLRHPVFVMVAAWMVLNVLELDNPESHSTLAWFYAMRGTALYFFLTILIALLVLDESDYNWFINIWLVFSILGCLWGLKQKVIGLDNYENRWLHEPTHIHTHLLFGKLRVFSFYSDAGQCGAAQAHAALVAGILFQGERNKFRKLFYLTACIFSTWGMLLSGTRGALFIPIAGGLVYLILINNWRLIIVALSVMGTALYALKYTFVFQSVYEIRRIRTALDPNNGSLLVRVKNQKSLITYLSTHIWGGGIGSAGYWGQRFSPNTFLANLALDSWYVRIAAEYGYPGLAFYVLMLIAIMILAYQKINRTQSPEQKTMLIALYAGLAGILVGSYGNMIFGQSPTGTLAYLSIFFLTATNIEKPSLQVA